MPEYSICPNSAASSASIGASSGLARCAGTATIRASNSRNFAAPAGNNRQTSPLRSIRSIAASSRIDFGRQAGGDRLDQRGKPSGQGHEHAIPGTAFRRPCSTWCPRWAAVHLLPHGADQAAVLLFHLPKAGKRGLDAQFLHVGRIDRADQRLDQPVERLPAKPAANESGHALVVVVAARRDEILHGRPQLAERAKDRRDGHRPKLRGGHHQETVRQSMQPAAPNHERVAAVRVGLHELVCQPQTLAQIEPPRHGGNEIVGTLLDLETVAMHGGNHAAQPRTGLEERHFATGAPVPGSDARPPNRRFPRQSRRCVEFQVNAYLPALDMSH